MKRLFSEIKQIVREAVCEHEYLYSEQSEPHKGREYFGCGHCGGAWVGVPERERPYRISMHFVGRRPWL